MAKAGTPSDLMSLPKSGGALQGVGEKFAPDLFTGTGNFTVPLTLPSGRHDFQLDLNLIYSTGNGNGPVSPRMVTADQRRRARRGRPV